jgi:hypothetical protein
MFWTRVKIAATVLLAVVGVLGTGAGVATYQKLAAQQPEQKRAQAQQAVPVVDPTDDVEREVSTFLKNLILSSDEVKALLATSRESNTLKDLLKARYVVASEEVSARFMEFMTGRGTLDIFISSTRRLLDAERELSGKRDAQIAAMEKQLRLLKEAEKVNQARYDAGRITVQDLAQIKYNRLDAEIALERAKGR